MIISLILPIRNEGEGLRLTLDAIVAQDYSLNDIEIIIADGMSSDNTRTIIEEYQQKYESIFLVDNPNGIVSTGFNIALLRSKGDFIIRVDGHTVIAKDYVRKCVDTLERTNADNVGGCMTAIGETNFGKVAALATSNPFGVGNSKFHYSTNEEDVDSVYMGAWPRHVFERIGMFDEELVRDQDDEFNYRLRELGGRIVLNPEIKSLYRSRTSLKLLWKQYFQYGYWKVRVLQKHTYQMSLRQFIPPLFVLGLIASIAISFIINWGWGVLVGYTGLYLAANLAASMITAYRKRDNFSFLLPIAFATVHLSYGLGFLVGLIKFWHRRGDKIGKVPRLTL